MYTIIDQLMIKENDKAKTEQLLVVKESLKIGRLQENSIELLDCIIKILKE